jgi:hypothetical protein
VAGDVVDPSAGDDEVDDVESCPRTDVIGTSDQKVCRSKKSTVPWMERRLFRAIDIGCGNNCCEASIIPVNCDEFAVWDDRMMQINCSARLIYINRGL